MNTITFQGTEEQVENLRKLLKEKNYYNVGEDSLPKEVVKTLRDVFVERLGHYVSEDDVYEAYDKLVDQETIDGDVMADDIVMMWEPLEFRYTVSQLLDEIA